MTVAPSRRSLVVAGAWSAPVIMVATAAPAFATSTTNAITFVPGGTGVVPTPFSDGRTYNDLVFSGASFQASGDLAAGALTLTITLDQATVQSPAVFVNEVPTGWDSNVDPHDNADSVTFTYGSAVTADTIVPFPDGDFVGANFDNTADEGTGTYTAVFLATGFAPATWSATTPPPVPTDPTEGKGTTRVRPGR